MVPKVFEPLKIYCSLHSNNYFEPHDAIDVKIQLSTTSLDVGAVPQLADKSASNCFTAIILGLIIRLFVKTLIETNINISIEYNLSVVS